MKAVIIGSTGLIRKAIAALLTDKGHETVQVSRMTQPGVDLCDLTSIGSFYRVLGEVDAIVCVAGRRIAIVHPPPVREAVIQNGIDGSRFPSAAAVAATFLSALESKITGQPLFVEGYRP